MTYRLKERTPASVRAMAERARSELAAAQKLDPRRRRSLERIVKLAAALVEPRTENRPTPD